MDNNNNRRDFLKNLGALGIGSAALAPLSSMANGSNSNTKNVIVHYDSNGNVVSKTTVVSILQTTDVHCQIHPHDELFWENEKTGKFL